MKGAGWHRCAYVLFEHSQPLAQTFSQGTKFQKRSFKTSDFYIQNQDNLTPVGLSFFQTEWDLSSRNVFHKYLGKICHLNII
jgi:large subunit ribosomal protein L38